MAAAKEVIRLKSGYDPKGDPNQNQANSQQADRIRQEAGLDDSMYGSGVSLSDALTNFHKQYGVGGGQQGGGQPVQTQGGGGYAPGGQMPDGVNQQPNQDSEMAKQEYMEMMKQSIDSGYESQKAQMDMALSNAMANLESQLMEAVQNGEMSVREAQAQFEAQRKQVEQSAYQQHQATKAYSNEMGIGHSQQSLGLQASDSARTNELHNTNISDRDKRINDVRDRINLIKNQANIEKTRMQSEYDYGLASARAQADSKYMEGMAGFMSQDYFTGKQMGHEERMQDKQFGQQEKILELTQTNDLIKMAVNNGYDLGKMDKEQINKLELMDEENKYVIQRMDLQHGMNKEVIGINFENEMFAMAEKFGYDEQMEGFRQAGQMEIVQKQIDAEIDKVNAEYKRKMAELKRHVTPGSDEYKFAELGLQREVEQNSKLIYSTAATNMQLEMIVNDPNLPKRGETITAPYDYEKHFGLFGKATNWISGYDKKMEEYEASKSAQEKLEGLFGISGNLIGDYANHTSNPAQDRVQGWENSIIGGIDKYQDDSLKYMNEFSSMINSIGGTKKEKDEGKKLLDSLIRWLEENDETRKQNIGR